MNRRNEAMIHLKKQGLSYAQIAVRYGISRQRVYQIISRDKIKLTGNNSQGLKGFFMGLLESIAERIKSKGGNNG